MEDTIYRQAAIDALQNILSELPSAQPDYDLSGYSDRLWKAAYERGKAEAQRTGSWIYVEDEFCWCCSSCKTMMAEFETKPVWNYCPNCGAKMEEL